ncbi:putative immunity protein [Saccharibacillus kuerlensis]|uniref:Imm-5-like domain-containing protein n=1 Tax=Saccharibacillus kuerlensis TaxID=459527 RepID=A0ABQ2L3B3_9BACL|nr:hypothetical protein [Saccharibacillus kuerlensis]GGO00998.1 hypothetical protein GCM10010969_22800 [Saccharibacillus kuerlensis]
MNIEEYAWDKHEQKLKQQTEFTYSEPKIKIVDDSDLRKKIEAALEELPQKLLAQWAVQVSAEHLHDLDHHLKNDPRIELGLETLQKRMEGSIGAYELRKTGFIVNQLSKESKTKTSQYAARSFAQAIAVGHMRGHALVSSDYAVKLVNLLFNNSLEAATRERQRQLKILNELEQDFLNKRT